MKNSIFYKILISYLALIFLAIAIIGGLQSLLVKNYLMENKEHELTVRGRELADIVGPEYIKGEDTRSYIVAFNQADRALGTEFWIIDSKGKVLAAAADHLYCEGNTLESADLEHLRKGQMSLKRGQSQYFNEAVIRVATPIMDKKEFVGAVVLFAPVKGVNDASSAMFQLYLGAAFFGVIVAAGFGWLLSRYITRPLAEVTRVAGKVSEGNFEELVEVKAADEFGKLGSAINHMIQRLSDSEKIRRDFIANVSHELRSPLTSIQGFVTAILEHKSKDREEELKYLSIIQSESQRLSNLINDLFEISKFDAQGIEFSMEHFPLGNTINRAVATLRTRLDDKNMIVKTTIPKNLPLCFGDEDRIEQVMHNLLSNAIQYSPVDGKILITCRHWQNEIYVEVADEGPGIPAEELEMIWERFYRVEKDRSRKKGGTGLGLAIVQEIVKKHHGRVYAESEPDQGAVFGFKLPVES